METATAPPRLSYRPEEAAHAIGISRTKVYQLIRAGKLKAKRTGRVTLVTAQAIEDFLNAADDYHIDN